MVSGSLVDRIQTDLQAEMERAVASPVQLLSSMLSMQVGSGPGAEDAGHSDRPRGILCLMVCEALSGEYRRALPTAAAVELAHLQFVVHGRIDAPGNQVTGANSCIEGRWGSGQAINAGDGLHAKARLAITQLTGHGCDDETVLSALRVLDHACARTCEGLHLQLSSTADGSSIDEYVAVAELKTGSLMGCAAGLGGLIAGSTNETREALHQCGSDLGVALQIRRDIPTYHPNADGLHAIAQHKMYEARKRLALLNVRETTLDFLERWAGAEESLG